MILPSKMRHRGLVERRKGLRADFVFWWVKPLYSTDWVDEREWRWRECSRQCGCLTRYIGGKVGR